jgi:hypothetical protein
MNRTPYRLVYICHCFGIVYCRHVQDNQKMSLLFMIDKMKLSAQAVCLWLERLFYNDLEGLLQEAGKLSVRYSSVIVINWSHSRWSPRRCLNPRMQSLRILTLYSRVGVYLLEWSSHLTYINPLHQKLGPTGENFSSSSGSLNSNFVHLTRVRTVFWFPQSCERSSGILHKILPRHSFLLNPDQFIAHISPMV